MEKVVYLFWKRAGDTPEALRERFRGALGQALLDSGVRHARLSIVDADVAPAAGLRMENSGPGFDGVLSLWVDTSVWRARHEALLKPEVDRFHGYLVCESEPIRHAERAPGDGSRVEGMCQVVLLQRPPRIAVEDWFKVWQGSHTQVAIDTQSTFGYRQNVVLRALTYAAPHYDAIVEENFPAAAMSSPHAFYDAVGDDARMQAHLKAMMDSCARFIDMDRIDVVPTSEYNLSR